MRVTALSTEKKQRRFKQSCSVVSRRTKCNKYQSTVDPQTRQQIKDNSEAPLRSTTQHTGLHSGVSNLLYDLGPAPTAGLMASEGPKGAAVLADAGAEATDITSPKACSSCMPVSGSSMHLGVDVANFLCYCSCDVSAYTIVGRHTPSGGFHVPPRSPRALAVVLYGDPSCLYTCVCMSGHMPGCNLTWLQSHS